MGKKRKDYAEFRFYEKPRQEPVIALMGEKWIGQYGIGIDFPHFHNMVEIGFCNWGKGRMIFSNQEQEYTEGSITFIPHNYLHNTISESLCQWSFLFFDIEQLIREKYQETPEKARRLLYHVTQSAFLFNIRQEHHLGELIKMIFSQMEDKHEYYKESVQSLLLSIVFQIAAKAKAETDPANREQGSKILPALNYIRLHVAEEMRINVLAQCCHMSETHFRRIFQQDMKVTPLQYINLARIQAACDLMCKGNNSMEDIAVKVGYQSMVTFNRNFRQFTGNSPYQWKMQIDRGLVNYDRFHICTKNGW